MGYFEVSTMGLEGVKGGFEVAIAPVGFHEPEQVGIGRLIRCTEVLLSDTRC